MLIYRLNNNISLFHPARSFCPHCKKSLSWQELIPLYSYIAQRGKCKKCKKTIPQRYLYTEIAFACLGILAWLLQMPIALFVLSLILLATVISDIEYQEIPYTLMCGALGGILWLGTLHWLNLAYVGIFALFIFGLERLVYKRPVFGGADILLFAILGLHFPLEYFLLFVYLAFVVGLIGALVGLFFFKMKRQDALPFAPYIIFAFYLTQYFGQQLLDVYWRFLGV